MPGLLSLVPCHLILHLLHIFCRAFLLPCLLLFAADLLLSLFLFATILLLLCLLFIANFRFAIFRCVLLIGVLWLGTKLEVSSSAVGLNKLQLLLCRCLQLLLKA